MEMTRTKMVLCRDYYVDNSRSDRLLSIELFEQEVHDEQLRQTLNTTGSLKQKCQDDSEDSWEHPIENMYRVIDVLIDEHGNIFANVKEFDIDI